MEARRGESKDGRDRKYGAWRRQGTSWKPAATKAGSTVEESARRRWQVGLRHDLDNNGWSSGQVNGRRRGWWSVRLLACSQSQSNTQGQRTKSKPRTRGQLGKSRELLG